MTSAGFGWQRLSMEFDARPRGILLLQMCSNSHCVAAVQTSREARVQRKQVGAGLRNTRVAG